MISRVQKQPHLKNVILSVRLPYVALSVEHLNTNDDIKGLNQTSLKNVILSVRLPYLALLVEHLTTNDDIKGSNPTSVEKCKFVSQVAIGA